MFKHIFVPTDGSELSRATAQRAVSFAKEAGARITVFFAKPEYPIAYFGEGALIDPTTPEKFAELAEQQAWLARYANAEDQAYFIIEYQNEPVGTVRLYDPQGESFCWGSWILKNTRPSQAAMESALMVYAYAVDHLGFKSAHFDVRKGNEKVWQFHERFGARRVEETAKDHLYRQL